MRRLKTTEVAQVRLALVKAQKGRCPLCPRPLKPQDAVLDHDHDKGHIRAAVHRGCNGAEGKIKGALKRYVGRDVDPTEYLRRLADYLTRHETPQVPLYHPTHRTPEEKRLAKNAAARKRRAAAKTRGT